MAVTTYSSNGTPSDAAGVTGDFNIDYLGKFLWGPKPTDTSWAGSAKSIVGPTGPTSGQALTFGTQSYGYAPVCGYGTSVALSSTPMELPVPGTTMTNYFIAPAACSFMGAFFNQPVSGTVVFQLWDKTAGVQVYSASLGQTTNAYPVGPFAAGAYPMTAGNVHVWRVTGSITTTPTVNPMYLVPSATVQNASYALTGVISDSPTYASSTYLYVVVAGGTTSGGLKAMYKGSRAAYVSSATFVATGTANLTVFLNNFGTANVFNSQTPPSGSGITAFNVTAANSPYTITFPVGTTGSLPLTANTPYAWNVAGSGSGNFYVNMQVVQ